MKGTDMSWKQYYAHARRVADVIRRTDEKAARDYLFSARRRWEMENGR